MKSCVVVSDSKCAVHMILGGLHDLATDYHLVEDLVNFVEVEDKIELANGSKVLVENLYEKMDELEVGKFIVKLINTQSEVKTCIPTVNDLMVPKFKEISHL